MNMKNANYFNIYYCFYINLILFLLELNSYNNFDSLNEAAKFMDLPYDKTVISSS